MGKARCNTELCSNLREPHNNVKPSNFWGSHQTSEPALLIFKMPLRQNYPVQIATYQIAEYDAYIQHDDT